MCNDRNGYCHAVGWSSNSSTAESCVRLTTSKAGLSVTAAAAAATGQKAQLVSVILHLCRCCVNVSALSFSSLNTVVKLDTKIGPALYLQYARISVARRVV
jgi:hypothetical protein